jgi:hypothetical protein
MREILHFVQNRPRVLSEAKDELILAIFDGKDKFGHISYVV